MNCPHIHRQLLLTPEAKTYLESEYSEGVQELAHDICRALDGRDEKDGAIRLTATGYLLFIIDPPQKGAPDRVVVWEGPTDGIFFKQEILDRTLCAGIDIF